MTSDSEASTPRKALGGPCMSDVTLTPTPQKLAASAQSTRSSNSRFMSPPGRRSAPNIHQFTPEEDLSTDEDTDDYQRKRVWSPSEEIHYEKAWEDPDAFSVNSPRLTDVSILAKRRAWDNKMSSLKLVIQLSVLFRILQFISLGCLGFPFTIRLWESLSVQLFMSVIASLGLLWRLSGRHSFPKHLAPNRMYKDTRRREICCLVLHGLCKLTAAVCLFVTSALPKGDFATAGFAVAYTAGGIAAGGFLFHLIFLITTLILLRHGIGRVFSSITSEINFMCLTLFASTEMILFTTVSSLDSVTIGSATIYCVTEVALGIVALLMGCWDLLRATRQLKESDKPSTSPLDLQTEPVFYMASPYRSHQ